MRITEVGKMALIVVKSQISGLVKEINKRRNFKINNVTSDFSDELDQKVRKVIERAMERAHANNRRTLMGRDI